VLPKLFPRFQAEMDRLPFQDGQFDCAIFNASFHYSENYFATFAEAVRCVRARGLVIIVDSPWYSDANAGKQMARERHLDFLQRFGFSSNALASQEFLTDGILHDLRAWFKIRWQIHNPWYGLRWAARPLVARLKNKREPSKFRIYAAEVPVV
jgi:hypothetical protein